MTGNDTFVCSENQIELLILYTLTNKTKDATLPLRKAEVQNL